MKYYNVTLIWTFEEKEVAKCGDGIISGNETCDLGGKEDGNIFWIILIYKFAVNHVRLKKIVTGKQQILVHAWVIKHQRAAKNVIFHVEI